MTSEAAVATTGTVLLRGGTVYSAADPFATAIVLTPDGVAWLGEESGADVQALGADEVVDLAGAWVAPAFVDAGQPAGTTAELASAGVLAVAPRASGAAWIPESAALTALIADRPGTVACVDPRDLDPAGAPLAAAAAAGVPLAFGTAPGREVAPWRLLQAALACGLSARAAFTAHTRGAWRAAGGGPDARLVVGAPATLVVWDAPDLVVQVADEARARFSTDSRAGLAPLPALGRLDDADWVPPRLVRAYRDGRPVAGDGAAAGGRPVVGEGAPRAVAR